MAVAAHQIEQESHEHDEGCAIFILSDRDDVLVDDASGEIPQLFGDTRYFESESTISIQTRTAFQARAPPLSNNC